MKKEIVKRYIEYMKEKNNISAAMVTGSYVTGKMGPNSDIDIFFIWPEEYKAMRGREYFEDTEFEYFISPEWKYYDRMRNDKVSMRIYSSSKVLYDPENKISKIIETARMKIKEISFNISEKRRMDLKFWIETICKDGEDSFNKGEYSNFLYFTSTNLKMMSEVVCELSYALPIYNKYGVDEILEIEKQYGTYLNKFLKAQYSDSKKKDLWVIICNYINDLIGDIDITNYESIQVL